MLERVIPVQSKPSWADQLPKVSVAGQTFPMTMDMLMDFVRDLAAGAQKPISQIREQVGACLTQRDVGHWVKLLEQVPIERSFLAKMGAELFEDGSLDIGQDRNPETVEVPDLGKSLETPEGKAKLAKARTALLKAIETRFKGAYQP